MRYADADAMRMALEQRLRNEVDATGVALIRLRKRVAFERFLARLAASPAEWVLKGAFALELRLGLRTRIDEGHRPRTRRGRSDGHARPGVCGGARSRRLLQLSRAPHASAGAGCRLPRGSLCGHRRAGRSSLRAVPAQRRPGRGAGACTRCDRGGRVARVRRRRPSTARRDRDRAAHRGEGARLHVHVRQRGTPEHSRQRPRRPRPDRPPCLTARGAAPACAQHDVRALSQDALPDSCRHRLANGRSRMRSRPARLAFRPMLRTRTPKRAHSSIRCSTVGPSCVGPGRALWQP